jgi:hypothetical protein
MVIQLREAEVLVGECGEPLDRVVGRERTAPNLLEKLLQAAWIH